MQRFLILTGLAVVLIAQPSPTIACEACGNHPECIWNEAHYVREHGGCPDWRHCPMCRWNADFTNRYNAGIVVFRGGDYFEQDPETGKFTKIDPEPIKQRDEFVANVIAANVGTEREGKPILSEEFVLSFEASPKVDEEEPEGPVSILPEGDLATERTLPFYASLRHAKENTLVFIEENLASFGNEIGFGKPPKSIVNAGIKWTKNLNKMGGPPRFKFVSPKPWYIINGNSPVKGTVSLEVFFGDLSYVIIVRTATYAKRDAKGKVLRNSDGSVKKHFLNQWLWCTPHKMWIQDVGNTPRVPKSWYEEE